MRRWDDPVQQRRITMAVISAEESDDNKALVYVNEHEK